jgi:hypothetical protein
MKKKKLPNKKKKRLTCYTTLDCYGIQPNSCKVGKITTSKVFTKDRADYDGHF